MAMPRADTVPILVRPRSAEVTELERLAPACLEKSGNKQVTGNQLAVALISAGLSMLTDESPMPMIPRSIMEMRARLRGESAPDADQDIKSLVRDALLSPEVLDAFLLRTAELAKKAGKRRK